ncbi:MAG: hypothetical protein AAF664_07895 [Planctomycetota bacterium]
MRPHSTTYLYRDILRLTAFVAAGVAAVGLLVINFLAPQLSRMWVDVSTVQLVVGMTSILPMAAGFVVSLPRHGVAQASTLQTIRGDRYDVAKEFCVCGVIRVAGTVALVGAYSYLLAALPISLAIMIAAWFLILTVLELIPLVRWVQTPLHEVPTR